MLIEIILIIVYAALSLPIFPYAFLGTRDDKEKSNNTLSVSSVVYNIGCWVVSATTSVAISLCCFILMDRQIWYFYVLPAFWSLFCQFAYALVLLKRKLLPIVIPVLILAFLFSIFFPIRDAILPYQLTVKDRNMTVAVSFETKKQIMSDMDIKFMSYQGYRNGQHFYTINRENGSFGLLTVEISSEEADSNTANLDSIPEYKKSKFILSYAFYPCKYDYSISKNVRDSYKSEEIISLGIVLDSPTPYGKFGVLKRDGIFERPHIDYYLLFNMESGEIIPYYEEQLPQFACD